MFRRQQTYERGPYHVRASKTNYVLVPPDRRTLNIRASGSGPGEEPGGFGTSNVWYPDTAYGERIRGLVNKLFDTEQRQHFDRDELEEQADALERLHRAPDGVEVPSRTKREVDVAGRSPEVQRWILQCADGRCELCGERAPFHKPNGEPFLEVHHVCRLADGGADVPENAVALCTNCHREAHHGAHAEEIRDRLSERVSRRSSA